MRTTAFGSVLTVLVGALVCVGPIRASALVERRVTPDLGQGVNLDTNSGRVRLRGAYRQQAAEPIVMEAERATVLRFVKGKGEMGRDTRASGGLYAAHIHHMEFHFELQTPGQYTAWYRGLFPWAGSWNHTEKMDNGAVQTMTDSLGKVLNRWIWTRGPTYTLAPGKHVWSFTPYAWMGGTRLDKVVLSPGAPVAPKGVGPAALPSVLPTRGEVVTQPVRPAGVVRWGRLQATNVSRQGTVRVLCSTDGARTWRPVPDGGDLSGLPTDKPVVLKLILTAGPDGSGPVLRRPVITYGVKKKPLIVLENAHVQWRFSGQDGTIRGLRNKVTGTEYMDASARAPLFWFRALRGRYGTVRDILFGQAELKRITGPAAGKLDLAYELMGGHLRVSLSIRLEGQLTRFSMQVANDTIYNIAEVIFPDLDGLRIGPDPSDDYLVTPILTGSIVRYPSAFQYPRAAYTDRPLRYPGMATMCWMDLWDTKGGGLYLAYEDKEYRLTVLRFSNGTGAERPAGKANVPPPPATAGTAYKMAKTPGPYIGLGFNKHMLISRRTGPVRVPDVVVGVHEGDWHWGADRYRQWAATWMKKTRVPDWWRDAEGWVDMHMTHLGDFVDLSKGWSKGQMKNRTRDPLFPMMAVWAQQAFSECYWSSLVVHRILGSPEQLAASVQKQHEMGHYMKFYSLPSCINPLVNRAGKRFGIVPRSMYPDDEVPPAGFFPRVGNRMYDGNLASPDHVLTDALVCMGATAWQQYLRHIVLDKYIREYGADGAYLDGTGLTTYECKNLDHGHAGYGEWTRGFMKWLTGVKRDARRVRPGAIFSGEGMGDVEHTLLDGALFYPEVACEVYRYTCPRNIGINHSVLPPHYKAYPKDAYAWICVFGLKFGGVGYLYDRNPAKCRTYLGFRRTYSQFQFRARFMDEQGLVWGDPALKGKLYVRDEPGTKGALLVVFNQKKKANTTARVAQARVGQLSAAWAYTLDGRLHRLDVRTRGGTYEFTVPASEMSAILLVERCEPLVDVARVAPVVPGEKGHAQVTVRNLEAKPLVGRVTLGLPTGWHSDTVPVTIASGKQQTVGVPFRVAPGTKYDVHEIYGVVAEPTRQTRKCIPMGVCRPVQAELHWTATDTVRLEMQNSSHKPVAGRCTLTTPRTVQVAANNAPFSLGPRAKGELVFRLRNVASIATREPIKAVLTYGKDRTEAHELIQPPVPNGGFEQCVAGDGNPDYWNYRWPHTLYYKKVALDTTVKTEGKQSLRIDPYPHAQENRISTTFVRLVPKTRYRFHVDIRRSAHHPKILCQFFSMYTGGGKGWAVALYLGQKKSGPVNVWESFDQEFTSCDIDVPYQIIVYNNTKGAATVWYDDIRIEEVKK